MSDSKGGQLVDEYTTDNGDTQEAQTSDVQAAALERISRVSSIISVLVGGLALFSDGYNAQVVGYMNLVMTQLYPNEFTTAIKTRLSNAFLIGEIFGMLFFGWAIDKLGRRTGIVWATGFMILGILLTTASHGSTNMGMFWMMIIGRGVAGFGAGGEYPTCATTSTEAADETLYLRRRRGILNAVATDFAIDLGFVVVGAIVLIILAAYHNHLGDGVWRISFGLGFILPAGLLFFRLRLINSTQYRKHSMKGTIPYDIIIKRYLKPMIGMSVAWFMYDFVVYPFGIFASTIISDLNPHNTLTQNLGYGTVVNCFYLPGTLVGGLLMDKIGRKQTMTLGFFLWALFGFILGAGFKQIEKIFPLFVILYGLFNSCGELGPGVALFLCGTEAFPTPLRGHFLGFAAAVGKAGSAIGTQVFTPIQDSFSDAEEGVRAVFLIGAAFATIGGVVSWFMLPDRDRDLESEDSRFRTFLEEYGYSGEFGESLEKEIRTTSFKF